jgi:hypothetical protein
MLLRFTTAALALALLAGRAPASDVESGPKKGAKLPALKVYNCTGDDKEKTTDHVKARKDKVTVYVLVAYDKFDRPMARFMKKLDEKLAADFEGVTAVAVFLTDNEDKTKKHLPLVDQSLSFEQTTLSVFKGTDGPKDWDVNTDAHLTVVIGAKGKVAARLGYKAINDTNVPDVTKELKKLTKAEKKKE